MAASVETVNPWMTVDEVADYLGKHPQTIYRWQRLLGFPRHKSETGSVRYHRDEVNGWMKRRFPWFEIPTPS